MAEFTPEYLSIDFLSLIEKFKEELKNSDIFKDYDFEGSNISILMELNAYVSELNTFFMNKVAKNTFLETADVYEAANRLARQVGYEPKGTRSARCTLQVSVSGTQAGDVLRVLPWKQLNSGRQDAQEGNEILFATTASVQATASGNWATIAVPVRQGQITDITGYTGDDLIDNELILPTEYSYDDDLTDALPSIRVTINDTEWTRLSDFYLDVIPEISDNVFMFVYDRYRRNKVVFNSSRNVPTVDDSIDVRVIDSLGTNGSIGADVDETWTIVDDELITLTRVGYDGGNGAGNPFNLSNDVITISSSAASIGADAPETVDEIRFNSASALRSQFRDVNSVAYNSYLSARSDVVKANAYGEQDLVPSGAGDPQEYNIVHISVIPEEYGNNTLQTSLGTMTTDWGNTDNGILVPTIYSTSWETELLEYLKSRKMISAYEIMEVPDLVYFTFEIGVRKKRIFEFVDIANDVKNKLIYYFRPENQLFNSEVDFNDIVEYLLDTSNVSPDDNFDNIKGIRNLNIRDINSNKTIYNYDSKFYPRWVDPPWTDRDNKLRPVKLGLNQFPYLSEDTVKILEEY
jgi:hypothetical protein